MTAFERAIKKEVNCDICGETMCPMPGHGWDNDRIICAARDCGAEIVYPTSTVPDENKTIKREEKKSSQAQARD